MKLSLPFALAAAGVVLGSGAYAMASPGESAADAKQDAYLQNLNKSDAGHDQRQNAQAAAFAKHQAKLAEQMAAARRSNDKAAIARLERIQAADQKHLQRAAVANDRENGHDARLSQLNKAEQQEDAHH